MIASVMTERLTNQDKITQLLTDITDIYEQYKVSSRYQIAAYEKQVQDFRTQAALIDGIKETYMEPYLEKLYHMLSIVGSPSRKVVKMPLISDQTVKQKSKEDPVTAIYVKAVRMLRREEEQHLNVMTRMLNKIRKNNIKLSEGQKAKDCLKREIEKQQKLIDEKQQQLEAAIELSQLYRDVLVISKEAVEQVILPELSAVRALLTALDVAEKVSLKKKEQTPETWPVIRLANTEYNKHYQFVKGVFAYYNLLLELYESSIAKELFGENKMNQNDIAQFMQLKDSLNKQLELIQKTLVFYA